MSNLRSPILLLSLLLACLCALPTVLAQEEAKKQEEPVQDRYAVPEGDVAALVKFLDDLAAYRPKTTEENLTHRQKATKALQTAVDRILELEKDTASAAYRKAQSFKLQFRLPELRASSPTRQREFYDQLAAHVQSANPLGQAELALAFTTGQLLDRAGNKELAKELYSTFGKLFSESQDEQLAGYGRKMLGVARRLDLVGNEMQIEGTLVNGDKFDWKSYRGKVVLVDYWATWCGPCIAELPNVKENYAKFHDQGFEVVGISLDEDRERLVKFIEEKDLPWACLFQDGAGWNHPMAEQYGIMAIPATLLVDRDGNVVSLSARGPDLGQQLTRLLGEPTAAAVEK